MHQILHMAMDNNKRCYKTKSTNPSRESNYKLNYNSMDKLCMVRNEKFQLYLLILNYYYSYYIFDILNINIIKKIEK